MKKLLLTLLCLLSIGAHAEWTFVGETETGKHHIDFSTIHRDGNKVKFWSLVDFSKNQRYNEETYFSTKNVIVIDCKEHEMNWAYAVFFRGHSGAGETVRSQKFQDDWNPIAPGGIVERYESIVCKQ